MSSTISHLHQLQVLDQRHLEDGESKTQIQICTLRRLPRQIWIKMNSWVFRGLDNRAQRWCHHASADFVPLSSRTRGIQKCLLEEYLEVIYSTLLEAGWSPRPEITGMCRTITKIRYGQEQEWLHVLLARLCSQHWIDKSKDVEERERKFFEPLSLLCYSWEFKPLAMS